MGIAQDKGVRLVRLVAMLVMMTILIALMAAMMAAAVWQLGRGNDENFRVWRMLHPDRE
jgi:hypothetical protein